VKILFNFRFYLIAFICFFSSLSFAATTQFTTAQQQEIQTIIHDYLLNNPQILLEAAGKLQQQTDKQNQEKIAKILASNANALLHAPNTPIFGNPKGAVTLVEFFDYQCSYCKKMSPAITKLAQTNPNLRIVMKEWPVFGESSDFAARAALASQLQNKYPAFHQALMATKGRLTNQDVLTVAKNSGLDVDKLQIDMLSKPVMSELKSNLMLAHALQLIGTPAFIITKTDGNPKNKIIFIPGAADIESLQKAIKTVE
jgi:protein-disulfide isomerase